MSWFKIDDSFWGHPKRLACSHTGVGVWVTAGSWCAQQLTDGFVPAHVLPVLGGRPRDASELVRVGLWETAEGGWRFHDWDQYQPSRSKVLADRDASAERQRRGRERARQQRDGEGVSRRDKGVTHAVTDAGVTGPSPRESRVSRPDPTRPVSSAPTERGAEAPAADADVVPSEDAQVLVGEWVDHCGARPPSRVVGHVAKELGLMLGEGIPYVDVRAGLAAWHGRGLHPSALASVVHETRTAAQRTPRLSRREQEQAATDQMYDRMMARAAEREAAEQEAS